MTTKFTPRLLELTYEAALKSYWRKEALRKFLRASHVAESFISIWSPEENKRDFLDRVFQKLQISDLGKGVIFAMSRFLSEQTTFPDLQNWEDSTKKVSEAEKAVAELKAYLKIQDEKIRSERDREEAKAKVKANEERRIIQKSLTDKAKLQKRLKELHPLVGT